MYAGSISKQGRIRCMALLQCNNCGRAPALKLKRELLDACCLSDTGLGA